MKMTVNVNDVLDGHSMLDLQCLDRVYLNGYVPKLQVAGQVVTFLTQQLGNPIPSLVLFKHIGNRFRDGCACLRRDKRYPRHPHEYAGSLAMGRSQS